MKIQTSELTGAALDWAVAKCEGPHSLSACYYDENDLPIYLDEAQYTEWQPSTNWAQGGPIIERDGIGIHAYRRENGMAWRAVSLDDSCKQYGPTPLTAAMRCYVATKLGDELDVPEGVTP